MQIRRPATNIIGLLTLLTLSTSAAHSGEELMSLAPGLQRVASDDPDKPTLRKNDVKLSLPTPTRKMPVDNDGFFKFDPNEVLLPPPLPSEMEEKENPTFDQPKPVAAAKATLRSQPSAAKTLSRTLSGEKASVFLGEVPGVVTPQQLAALLKDEERYIAFGKPVDVVLDMAAVGFPEWLFGPGPLRKTTPAAPESVMAMAGNSSLPPMPAPPLADTQVATLEPFSLPIEPATARPHPLSVPDPIVATSTVFHSMPPPPAPPADSQPAWTPPPQNNTSDNDAPSSGPLLLRIPPQMSQAASGPPPVGAIAAGNRTSPGTVSVEPAPRRSTSSRPSSSGSKGSSAASVPAALSPREFTVIEDSGYYDQPRSQRQDARKNTRNTPQTGKKRTNREPQPTRNNRNSDGFVPLRSAGNVIGPPDPKMFSTR